MRVHDSTTWTTINTLNIIMRETVDGVCNSGRTLTCRCCHEWQQWFTFWTWVAVWMDVVDVSATISTGTKMWIVCIRLTHKRCMSTTLTTVHERPQSCRSLNITRRPTNSMIKINRESHLLTTNMSYRDMPIQQAGLLCHEDYSSPPIAVNAPSNRLMSSCWWRTNRK